MRSPGIQETGIRALGCMAVKDETNRYTIARAGGVDVVLVSMRLHPGKADLQEAGCRALEILAVTDANKRRVAASGGIETIVATMRQFEKDALVQAAASLLLGVLSFDDQCNRMITRTGGIAMIVAAMRQFSEHAEVMAGGCRALCILATGTTDENRPNYGNTNFNNKIAIAAAK